MSLPSAVAESWALERSMAGTTVTRPGWVGSGIISLKHARAAQLQPQVERRGWRTTKRNRPDDLEIWPSDLLRSSKKGDDWWSGIVSKHEILGCSGYVRRFQCKDRWRKYFRPTTRVSRLENLVVRNTSQTFKDYTLNSLDGKRHWLITSWKTEDDKKTSYIDHYLMETEVTKILSVK